MYTSFISVIIPNYNHAPYLVERIDSVLHQTFQDFEVIILDDKSTDNSREIIETYRHDPKVSHIIYNDENSGSTFKQWEKGFQLAKGEWIWIAESDDIAETTFLEELASKLLYQPEIVLAYSSSMEIDSKSRRVKVVDWAYNISDRDWYKDYTVSGISEIKKMFFYKCIIPNASAVLFKKSCINYTVLEKMKQMKFAGDWLFWVSIIEQGNIYYSSKVLNYFRFHDHTTRNTKNMELESRRFKESLSVIYAIKRKYRLKWNWNKHYWIINDWFYKYSLMPNKRMFNILKFFPFSYRVKMILKIALNNLKNKLKIK